MGKRSILDMKENLELSMQWDKTFPKSEKVDHQKVTFRNRYGITLAADLYVPKNAKGKLPAIAVSGPFGAVKEQSSGLYAQAMAEKGFLAIAFDPLLQARAAVAQIRGLPGHQHRGFSRPQSIFCLRRTMLIRKNRDHWHLRLGRNGFERGGGGYQDQGDGNFHYVRHEPGQCKGIF